MAEVDAGALAPAVVPASTDAPAIASTADVVTESPQGEDRPVAPQRIKFDDEQQKEVDRIVAKRVAQESRRMDKARAEARAELAAERQQAQPQPRPQVGAPKPEDFKNDYEAYLIAKAKYEFKQEQAAERETTQRETAAERDKRQQSEYAEHVQSKVRGAQEKYEDFNEVIEGGVFSAPMTAYIAEVAKDGGELAYYLGTHRDEAIRIAKLPPAAQPVELHLLESKLNAAPATTKVPAPIVPNAPRVSVDKKLEDAGSQEEFNAIRRRQLAAKGRR